jgi:outer membrane protein OmpA-like peptidoglycan-associated protein
MKRSLLVFIALLLPAAACVAQWNQPNVPGAKEHRLLKFYPQAQVATYDRKDFDSAEIVTAYKKGAAEGQNAKTESLEGTVTRYKYLHKPNTSTLEILRQYEGALKQAGLVTVVAGKGSALPGIDINGDETYGSFRLDRDGTPAAFVAVKAVLNCGPECPESEVTIVELKLMEQVLEANADVMYKELQKSGRVSVYGINFDTGKSLIKADSAKVLNEVKKLLDANPALRLTIEGHTDNVGNAVTNKKLSADRADAVKDWLSKAGIAATKLATAGFGDTRKVADNATEEGRAKNRRVELVKN